MSNADVRVIKTEWLVVIILLLVQTVTITWWASGINNRVENLELSNAKGERFTAADGLLLAARVEAFTSIAVNMQSEIKAQTVVLQSLERRLDDITLYDQTHAHPESGYPGQRSD